MAKRLQEYVKYTTQELESYTKTCGSCVRKENTNLHLTLGPYGLADFKSALQAHIVHRMVGFYDERLSGIVLDVKNIKVQGTSGAIRVDDPHIHININADCYIFRPEVGAVLNGIVKHIGNHHVGVIIYRVFNANIRFEEKLNDSIVQVDQEVQFRMKNFNLRNVFPYIEGDLLIDGQVKTKKTKKQKIKKEHKDSTVDSGIEEKDVQELDEISTLIKEEQVSLTEENTSPEKKSKKGTKRKRKTTESSDTEFASTPAVKVKNEPKESTKKRKSKTNVSIKLENSIDDS